MTCDRESLGNEKNTTVKIIFIDEHNSLLIPRLKTLATYLSYDEKNNALESRISYRLTNPYMFKLQCLYFITDVGKWKSYR